MSKACSHKWVWRRSNSYWRFTGRFSREYYYADYYFCEKCLEEKIVEKRHTCYDSEVRNLPDWARTIQKQVSGYE